MLYAVCCMLYAVCCMLYAVCCMLYAVCCMLYAVCCMLYAVCCMPYVYCILYTVYYAVCCMCCICIMAACYLPFAYHLSGLCSNLSIRYQKLVAKISSLPGMKRFNENSQLTSVRRSGLRTKQYAISMTNQ